MPTATDQENEKLFITAELCPVGGGAAGPSTGWGGWVSCGGGAAGVLLPPFGGGASEDGGCAGEEP